MFETVINSPDPWAEYQKDFIRCDVRSTTNDDLIITLYCRSVPRVGEVIRITGAIGIQVKTVWEFDQFTVDAVEHMVGYNIDGYARHHVILKVRAG